MAFSGFSSLLKIYEGRQSFLYRATAQPQQIPVVIKTLRDPYPDAEVLDRFRQESELTRRLAGDGVIACLDFQSHGNRQTLVLEDFGGFSLDRISNPEPWPVLTVLQIALQVVAALQRMHRLQVVHRDLNPSHIIYHSESGVVKLIDFGMASLLACDRKPSQSSIDVMEAKLSYIAPEQTGRVNHEIDYRADYYALGVILYEMLTGRLPFITRQPLELIHAHIAFQPQPLKCLRADIPEILSQIVLKLLAKTPEERYQGTRGLKQDLQICINQLQVSGSVTAFHLSNAIDTERLHIPSKLYGRELETQSLKAVFHQVQVGQSQCMLVTGYTGVGKTALVQSLQEHVFSHGGAFIAGKFDQYRRGIPYAALIEAIEQRIKQILNKVEPELAVWQANVRQSLGSKGQLLIDVIPSLSWLLGQQPPIPPLPAHEFEALFNSLMRQLVRSLASINEPLVILLDDLQWADLSSIVLLKRIQNDAKSTHILLIGTYRNHEIDTFHPLSLMIQELQEIGKGPPILELHPLTLVDIQTLLSESLREQPEALQELALLCQEKTQGNAFFLRQFLESLYTRQLLQFDEIAGRWIWQIADIRIQSLSDNVAEFVAMQLADLPEETRSKLSSAAFIGNCFELTTVATLCGQEPEVALIGLQGALVKGLIYSVEDHPIPKFTDQSQNPNIPVIFQFSHDRIQQSAYSLISIAEGKKIHLQLARILSSQTNHNLQEQRIFEIVNHYSLAIDLVETIEERDEVTQYAYMAGIRAKQSAAYQSALGFFITGIACLDHHSWETHYSFTLNLYREAAETAYLATDYERMELFIQIVLSHAKSLLDQILVHEINIKALIGQKQLIKSIDYAIGILVLLDIKLPKVPNQSQVIMGFLATKLALYRTSIDTFVELPIASEAKALVTMRILSLIISAAYYANPLLVPLLTFNLVQMTIRHGISPESSYAFMVWGLLLCSTGEIERGYKFGQMAVRLNERIQEGRYKDRGLHVFNFHIRIWKEHYRVCQQELKQIYAREFENGDLEFAAFSALAYCNISYYLGDDLLQLSQSMNEVSQIIHRLGQVTCLQTHEINRQLVHNLLGLSAAPDQLRGDAYDSTIMVPRLLQENDISNLFVYYCAKASLNIILGNYEDAAQAANENQKYLEGAKSTIYVAGYYFFGGLAYAALYDHYPISEKTKLLRQVKDCRKQLAPWAKLGPMNHKHHLALLDAEIARIENRDIAAVELYEQAIAGAREQGYLNDEALASEFAARYHLARGNQRFACAYWIDARYYYARWGAQAKVDRMDATNPQLLGDQVAESFNRYNSARLGTVTFATPDVNQGTILSLDVNASVLDASVLVQASQTISEEIILPKLIQKLMQISLKYSGAVRGLLIFIENGRLMLQADFTSDTTLSKIPEPILLQQYKQAPFAIIQYIARTQENIVIDDAISNGQFTQDAYIKSAQSKSILGMPLHHQGKFIGILYLENHLTIGAFTPDRVKILQILSAQAAISIENSRLYQRLEEYNHTLEESVKDRTQELSQTLDILKATQAELVIENMLLKEANLSINYDYQVGGSLPLEAPTYVVRNADRLLYKALKLGQYCYILNSRQMGKSSLRIQVAKRLRAEGILCIAVDLSEIGSHNISREKWYAGFIYILMNRLPLADQINFRSWWEGLDFLSPVQRLSEFIHTIVLGQTTEKIVIFIDEVDSVLNLNFAMDDFFILLRSCFNQRAEQPHYQRLTFVFLGVASPSQLVDSTTRTPFNIGEFIPLKGFQSHEAQPLLKGIAEKVKNPQVVLNEILTWTGGQPFLTQKLCKIVSSSPSLPDLYQEAEWIEQLVRTHIIEQWEIMDEPEHLRTIRDRLLSCEPYVPKILELYYQILEQETVFSNDDRLQNELILSGLVTQKGNMLQVSNPIYQLIFNQAWVEQVQTGRKGCAKTPDIEI